MLAYMYLGKSNNPSCWSGLITLLSCSFMLIATEKNMENLILIHLSKRASMNWVPKGVSRAMVDLEMSFYARISCMEDNMMLRRFN
ncbi:hypothetical protein Hanom_Chr01g00045081 [Helianthus anomalus]